MMIDENFVIPALLGKTNIVLSRVLSARTSKRKHHKLGEQFLSASVGSGSYAIIDVLTYTRKKFGEITIEEMQRAGFKTKRDMELWWFLDGGKESDEVNLINFDLIRYKRRGLKLLMSNGYTVPRIKA